MSNLLKTLIINPLNSCFSILAFAGGVYSSSAQTMLDSISDYSWVDTHQSVNNLTLFQGQRYLDSYRILNDKHRYLDSFDFMTGDLIYQGDLYKNLHLKFDLYEQQLVLFHPESDGVTYVAPNMNEIAAFKIGERIFAKKTVFDQQIYLEQLGNIQGIEIWEYHYKKLSYRHNDNIAYYEFVPKNTFYIFDGTWHLLKMNSSLIGYFPKKELLLKNTAHQWRSLQKKNPEAYIKKLIEALQKR